MIKALLNITEISGLVFVFAHLIFCHSIYAQTDRIKYYNLGSQAVSVNIDYGIEQNVSSGINKVGLRLGYEKYHRTGFSFGGEFTIKHYNGKREEAKINMIALGAGYILKWYFLKAEFISFYFDHGGGVIFTREGFPPPGTKVNGLINIGIGISFLIKDLMSISLGVRDYHSSNGKGFAENNPAYDATIFYAGINRYF